jgi:hypothetical protein
MPIRLNLLAEAQAAADMRRRDPVKRAILVGAVLVALMLAWSGFLQFKCTLANRDFTVIESKLMSHTNQYSKVMSAKEKAADAKMKVAALQELADKRFLNGNLMQALQRTTVEDVQLVRLRLDQAYAYVEGTKPKTNDLGHVIQGTKSKATEKILLTLEGTDTSLRFDQYTKYQDTLSGYPYFKETLVKTNAVTLRSGSLSMPQLSAGGKPTVSFAFELRYPEKTR